jgi:hypothetical protein
LAADKEAYIAELQKYAAKPDAYMVGKEGK